MVSSPRLPALGTATLVVLAILAAVVAGAVVAPLAYDATAGVDGTVAVVEIEGTMAAPVAAEVEAELRNIRADDDIQAVVLAVDTPGGMPAPTEQMYKAIKRTSDEMPVYASTQSMAASAGYYLMMPADEIYVKPTSQIGSVGLNTVAPTPAPPAEGPSGPDKTGANPIEMWANYEILANTFIETVMEDRGDRLELTREEIAHAKVYPGIEAVDNGVADEIGSVEDAAAAAAADAGLDDYDIEYVSTAAEDQVILLRTDDGIVAVTDEQPSMGDVKEPTALLVHEPAIPHIDTVDSVLDAAGTADKEGETE